MSALIEFDEVCKYYQMGDTTVLPVMTPWPMTPAL